MVDVKSAEQSAQAAVAKVESQWAFVRANWTQVSIIVIAATAIGFVVGHWV